MARKAKPGPVMIPVRNLSRLPGALRPVEAVMTRAPDFLVGDRSAFAFYPPTGTVAEIANVTMMYASNRRDPARRDTVLIDMKNGDALLRHIHSVEDDGYVVDNYIPDIDSDCPQMICSRQKINFDDIVNISVIVLAKMI